MARLLAHVIAMLNQQLRLQMSWADFIRSHTSVLAGIDFFTAEVLTWRGLATYYVLFFLHL